jgi:hypothetical protein
MPGSSPTTRALSLIPRTLVGHGLHSGPGTAPWRHESGLPSAGSGLMDAMSRLGQVDSSLSMSGCTAARGGAQTVPAAGYAVSPGPDRRENFGPLPCHRYTGLTELSSMGLSMTSSGTLMPLRDCARSGLALLISARHLRCPSTSEQLRAQNREALGEGERDAYRLQGDRYGVHGGIPTSRRAPAGRPRYAVDGLIHQIARGGFKAPCEASQEVGEKKAKNNGDSRTPSSTGQLTSICRHFNDIYI